ncbi:unnamed protein product [Timema podura]|uniref:Uncharacterized protein n=1 Tax=Timema podura TaxID=61482 RepID=A0ABN7P0Y0_TIMPD|nr:unnamed protein product [Timema podura]
MLPTAPAAPVTTYHLTRFGFTNLQETKVCCVPTKWVIN